MFNNYKAFYSFFHYIAENIFIMIFQKLYRKLFEALKDLQCFSAFEASNLGLQMHQCLITMNLRESITHSIRSQCSHHAQSLQCRFIFPLLRKLFLLRTFRLDDLFPPLRLILNIAI